MSFTGSSNGKTYAPGYFLNHEECERKTTEIPQSLATTEANGTKYVKMGTPFPSNDGDITGFVYEDVDVTSGNMPGSVVYSGTVIVDRLPVKLTTAAATAMASNARFVLMDETSVTRPY